MTMATVSHDWSQTRTELTLTLPLPPAATARGVRCSLTPARALSVSAAGRPLLKGSLHADATLNTWTVDCGVLYVEMDKAAARFWPRLLVGGPEVDVSALLEAERREKEPAYRPPPGACRRPAPLRRLSRQTCSARAAVADAAAAPRKVSDRETLLKLKAEFPQLELPLHVPQEAAHRQYTGARREFEWGAIPSDEGQEAAHAEAVADGSGNRSGSGSCGNGSGSSSRSISGSRSNSSGGSSGVGASSQSHGGSGPAASAALPPSTFAWGALPAETAAERESDPPPATCTSPVETAYSLPPSTFAWGALPTC